MINRKFDIMVYGEWRSVLLETWIHVFGLMLLPLTLIFGLLLDECLFSTSLLLQVLCRDHLADVCKNIWFGKCNHYVNLESLMNF